MAIDSAQTDSDCAASPVRCDSLMGRFEESIILATLACGPSATVEAIRYRMEATIGSRGLTAICSTLDRLGKKGLIDADELSEPTKRKGGRKRRLYKVTEEGRDSVVRSIAITADLARAAGLYPESGDRQAA